MIISIETGAARFMLSVQPRFVQSKGLEQSTFDQHHERVPISVVVKCCLPFFSSPSRPSWLNAVTNADLSTLWKAVFRGLQPAAMTLAAEGEDILQAALGRYRELLDRETEELGQIGGAVRFACSQVEEGVVEGLSQYVERWYVVDGQTMRLTGM